MITIPEVQLKRIIDYCLETVRDDYRNFTDKSKTYLADVFEDLEVIPGPLDFNYFEECAAMIMRSQDHPRHIETHHFLNRERWSVPTIHITLNANSPGPNGIGYDMNFANPFCDKASQNVLNMDEFLEYRESGRRAFNTRFQVVITSDNTFEVLMLYYLLTACLVGNVHLLELNGIRNPSLLGNDIILQDHLAPPNIYARAIMIDCFFEMIAPSFRKKRDVLNTFMNGGAVLTDCEEEGVIRGLSIPDIDSSSLSYW